MNTTDTTATDTPPIAQPSTRELFAARLLDVRDWFSDQVERVARMDRDDVRTTARIIGSVVGPLLAVLLVVLAVIGIVSSAGNGDNLADSLRTARDNVANWSITRTITDPISSYLAAHTTGLAATAGQLSAFWGIGGLALLLTAWARSWGARLGWVVYGVATTAMVYAGAPAPSQATAAGVTALAWSLLTVLAASGIGRRSLTIHNHIPQPKPNASTPVAAK